MRTILLTAKGGVGKTTLSASMALASARRGYRTLSINTDIAHSLADALGVRLDNNPRQVCPYGPFAAELDTAEALERAWGDVRRRLAALLTHEGISGPVAGELATIPGLDEILALARIKRLQDEGQYDVMIIDSASTGGRDAPAGSAGRAAICRPRCRRTVSRHRTGAYASTARDGESSAQPGACSPADWGVAGPRRSSARVALRWWSHFGAVGPQCRSPISERNAPRLYVLLPVRPGSRRAVCQPHPPRPDCRPFVQWREDQTRHQGEIRKSFAPLPVHEVPLLQRELVGLEALGALALTQFADDPVPAQAGAQAMAFRTDGALHVMALRISGLSPENVEIEKRGSDLHIRLGRFRHCIVLPDYLAAMTPVWASVDASELLIAFRPPV